MLFRTPQALKPMVVQDFAQGRELGGNNTCFKSFEEAQEYLTKAFTNPQGVSYLEKINASFAMYWSMLAKTSKKSKAARPPLEWTSNKLLEYIFFLCKSG